MRGIRVVVSLLCAVTMTIVSPLLIMDIQLGHGAENMFQLLGEWLALVLFLYVCVSIVWALFADALLSKLIK